MNAARSILLFFNRTPFDEPIPSPMADLTDWVTSSNRVLTF